MMTDNSEAGDFDDLKTDETKPTRKRTQTEKVREYDRSLSINARKNCYKKWRRKLNRLSTLLVDSEDVTLLRTERNELDELFNELTARQERLEECLENDESLQNQAEEDYDCWDRENAEALKHANNRITELLTENSDNTSTRSSRTRVSSKTGISTSSRTRKTEMAIKAARLDAELRFHKSEKMVALRKQEEEMQRLKLEKELTILKAELDAFNRIKEEEETMPPLSDEDEKDEMLQKYLNDQLSQISLADAQQPKTPGGNDQDMKVTNHGTPTPDAPEVVNNVEMKMVNPGSSTSDPPEVAKNNPYTEMKNHGPSTTDSTEVIRNDSDKKTKNPGFLTADSTEVAEKHTDKKNKNLELSTADSSETPPPNSVTPTYNTDALTRLADLLSQRQERDHLPRPEPEIFSGNLLRFPLWIKSFETLIENRTSLPAERLYYLGRYTSGEAKEAVSGLLSLNSENAYIKAKRLLHNRYGNTFLIADAYRKRINDWPKIAPNDGPSLRKLSDFLEHCKSAMEEIKYLSVLNDPEENQRMLKKLPSYLVTRWSRIVDRWLTNDENDPEETEKQGYPPFAEFCDFLKTEARIACNPVTSLRQQKALEESSDKARSNNAATPRRRFPAVNSFATRTKSTDSETRPKETAKKDTCSMCNADHELDGCKEFLKLSLQERKEYARSRGLCWGCLKQGHKSRQCRTRKTCEVCKGLHPSCLHDYAYKSNSGSQQPNKADGSFVSNRISTHPAKIYDATPLHSMILPVWIRHVEHPDKQEMVYALLDEQSDACFVSESILKRLGIDGPDVDIELSTVLGRETIQSKRITGLIVRGVKEDKEIQLPRTYTRNEIPAKRSQIPSPESADRWPHLKRISRELSPYQDNIEVGLLIGLNCISALRPCEVIPGYGNEPYGRKTALGWGIIGMIEATHYDEVPANHAITQKSEDSPYKPAGRFVFQNQSKEVFSTKQVQTMFEMDFNEKETGSKPLSLQDHRFLEILRKETRQLPNGHYEMPLPFKADHVVFENNVEMALKRLMYLKRRLQSDEKYRRDYVAFMQAIIDAGHAEKVEDTSPAKDDKVWYIPHHGVYHPKKPGKIRVVFDCSAAYKGQSLNKQLLQGPDLANSLVGVLCRFRLEPIAFMCDIEKMFHQVKVRNDFRDFLRFLWWDNADLESQPKIYRMTVHLFGAVSSPGCANYALKKVADDFRKECGDEAADFIKGDFYVDDGLKSVPTVEDAVSLINNTKTLCSKGGFHLHKFTSNAVQVIEGVPPQDRADGIKNLDIDVETMPIERALGVQWCVESDTFQFRITLKDRPFTRRGILATVSSIFDPLGLVAPVILLGKTILQSLCQEGVDWDERVPDAIRPKWERWRNDLRDLSTLKINRCVKPFTTCKSAELHHFSDASNEGYGQCSYLRVVDDSDQVHCSLVMAKSRVTPLKPITIPRLELSAALVSVRISQLLQREMGKLSLIHVFWTDSRVALGYINNEARRFHTFVSNRVQQIREHSTPDQWHYVDTKQNPADHASRGLSASELTKCHKWWNGPDFLQIPALEYSNSHGVLKEDDPELKRVQAFAAHVKEQFTLTSRLDYFSDWHRAKKSVALCLRLQDRFRGKTANQQPKEMNKPTTRSQFKQDKATNCKEQHILMDVSELQRAEHYIIKDLQREHFKEEIQVLRAMGTEGEVTKRSDTTKRNRALKSTSSLFRLDPFLDDNGLLRVGGRLMLADIPYGEKHPLILPKKSHITSLILCHFHERARHQGHGITQQVLRTSGYWIVGGKSVISQHISKCVKCRKLRGTTQTQKMANLPGDRLEPAPPFTYSAVDCFGPWLIKEGRREVKRYGALFTCMASRAIHIEVLNTMESNSFINAYRRFVGRRGPVRQLRSDQGTNFVGARNELQAALTESNREISKALLRENCDWVVFKTNAPHASHMGGVWERQIRSARSVLNALLERQGTQLDDESLRTLMVEAEAVVNSRPLTTESASSTESTLPLSPSNLLTMKTKVILPPPGNFQRPDLYSRKRWRRVQFLANEFWNKWKKTFLQSLQQRPKWTTAERNIQVNDIVVVKEEGQPRNKWSLARVTETYPSDDGKVRKVQVAVADSSADSNGRRTRPLSTLQRPIHKLVLLYSREEQERDRGIPIEEP